LNLVWGAVPFLVGVMLFLLLSIINWDYESKMVTHPDGNWTGIILLGMCMVDLSISGILFYTYRMWLVNAAPSVTTRLVGIVLFLLALLMGLAGWFVIGLGPAGIELIQNTGVNGTIGH